MTLKQKTIASLTALWLALTPTYAAADTPDDTPLPAATVRADFDALYQGLQKAHADLYAHRPKAAYDTLYTTMRESFARPMTPFAVRVAFQKFTAFGNVAHARIDFPDDAYQAFRDKGGLSFPIYLRIADGRAYVGENLSGNSVITPGDEILTLNGTAMQDWLTRTGENISADTPYIAHSLLEFMFPQYLWLELGEVPTFQLTLRGDNGQIYKAVISASSRDAQRAAADMQPARFTLAANERKAEMLDGTTAYLRPGPFYNFEAPDHVWDNTAFVAFIDTAFERFIKAGATALVIDLRENPGGDNSFSDAMLAWIADRPFRFCSAFRVRSSDAAAASNQARLDANPGAATGASGMYARKYAETPRGEVFDFEIPYARPRDGKSFKGKVYVLINRHSYSNAVNVAAMVQDYGFGTIVGEKTSDMATTYGAMETFTLPATGIVVSFPKAHIIRPSGDPRSDGVTPDWVIASPIKPAETDLVLETLLAGLRARD